MENQENNTFYDQVSNTINKIKPYLQADGGDIELVEVTDDKVVKVKLLGACGSCPFRLHTLKSGVEQALKKEIPDVKEVTAVE
ncbi:MAG: NifU family protein [Bacteroidota bacterium]